MHRANSHSRPPRSAVAVPVDRAVAPRLWHIARAGLLLMMCLLTSVVPIAVTLARFSAQTANPGSVFSTTALYAPAGLSATLRGHDVRLSWTAGRNGSGYRVLGGNNGTSASCPPAATASFYNAVGTIATTTYTDTRSTPQGTWFCYQVQTSYLSWASVEGNPVAGVQLGVVANSLNMINGGLIDRVDRGDRIVVTFNQPIDPATGPRTTDTICADKQSDLFLLAASNTSGQCRATELASLGRLNGPLVNADARFAATYSWGNNNQTITVTVGSRISGGADPVVSSGTWTFVPATDATKLLSATGRQHVCDSNTGGGNCTPSTTSRLSSRQQAGESRPAAASPEHAATPSPTGRAAASPSAVPSKGRAVTPAPESPAKRTPTAVAPPAAATRDVPPATAAPVSGKQPAGAAPAKASPTVAPAAPDLATRTPTRQPAPVHTATVLPTHTATALPSHTATLLPTATRTQTSTPSATASPQPTATETPSATPSATATLEPSPTATATPSATATAEPSATATLEPSPTVTSSPAASATPTPVVKKDDPPTATPSETPSPTATPVESKGKGPGGPDPTPTVSPTVEADGSLHEPAIAATITPTPTSTSTLKK